MPHLPDRLEGRRDLAIGDDERRGQSQDIGRGIVDQDPASEASLGNAARKGAGQTDAHESAASAHIAGRKYRRQARSESRTYLAGPSDEPLALDHVDHGESGRALDRAPAEGRGVVAGLVLNAVTGSALRFAPPLTVSDDEIDTAVAMLAKVLSS